MIRPFSATRPDDWIAFSARGVLAAVAAPVGTIRRIMKGATMSKFNLPPAFILPPVLALVASLALSAGATAQTEFPAIETDAPGVAMALAQARQSPFHALATPRDPVFFGAPLPRLPRADLQVPGPAQSPSFHGVFWPTFGSAVGSWVLALALSYPNACDLIDMRDGRCPGESRTRLAMILGSLVVIPPAVANLAGASFSKALMGSLAGLAGGVGVGVLGMAPLTPVVHAALTTVLGRL